MGFNFGTQPTSTAPTGSLFNNNTTSTSTSGGLFGLPNTASSSASTPLFGNTNTSSNAASTSLFGNKTATTTSTTPSLFGSTASTGTAASSTPSLFGNTSVTGTSAPSLFGGASTSTTAKTSLFGNTTTSTTATPSLLGNTTTSTANTTLNLGGNTTSLFGNNTTQPTTKSLFGDTPATGASTIQSNAKDETVTLGGIKSDNAKLTGPKAWRNEQVPQPVCAIIDNFKKFLKEQKDLRDEVSRFSPSSIDKVKEEVDFLIKKVRYLSHSIAKDSAAINSLKNSVVSESKNCEIAERTRDSTNLPLEVSLPMEYFYKLVNQFEECIQLYKVQIDEIESVMNCNSSPESIANVSSMLSRMHQIFVALAGKLHSLHEDVKLQKDFYLNYRKVIFKDESNIFDTRRNAKATTQVCPTPFSDTTNSITASLNQKAIVGSNLTTLPASSYPISTSTIFSSTIVKNTSINIASKPSLGVKKLF